MAATYDRIGTTYGCTRRPDPRIADQIAAAVGDGTVVNIGAGTGSYETASTTLAVEPSMTMIRQRPRGAAPCVQASAESLPLADASFDVAMAVLTVHHWSDLERGIAEMRRVAARQVILTWELLPADAFWLTRDYLPELTALDAAQYVPVERIAELLGGRVEAVPIAHDCRDGFYGAFWRRPHAYLDPLVRAGISSFAVLGDTLAPALARLESDLASGMWQDRNADICGRDEFDAGYRLVIAPA